jgi:hypothetical protein
MGTISTRTRKDGSEAFLAQITVKKDGAIVLREAETFDRKQAANAWIVRREAPYLGNEGALNSSFTESFQRDGWGMRTDPVGIGEAMKTHQWVLTPEVYEVIALIMFAALVAVFAQVIVPIIVR